MGPDRRFKTPRWVSQATWFAFDTARFEAAQSAGRLALLPSEEQYRFGLVVGSLRTFRGIQLRETDAWSTLRMLQSGPEVLRQATGRPSALRCRTPRRSTTSHRSAWGKRFLKRQLSAGGPI